MSACPADDPVVAALGSALKPFAEWALPPGVEATIGREWLARWRARAQDALLRAGMLDASLAVPAVETREDES